MQRKKLIVVSVGLAAVVVAVLAVVRFPVWQLIMPPPKYEVPADLSPDERKAVEVAQDTARKEKGRLVRFESTVLFKNQHGNYRIRGACADPFDKKKGVHVYEAIVDAQSFECLEFGFD